MVETLEKTVWQLLIKLDMHLLHDPATLLLDSYPRKMKTYTQKPGHTFYNSPKLETI